MKKQSYVYFFKPCGVDGPIKIGCSESPEDRMATFAAWSPWPLEMIGRVPGTTKDEIYLHRCFWQVRSHGEWFRSSPELRAAIHRVLVLGVVPRDIVPDEMLGTPQRKLRTPEHKLRMSYRMRVDWQERKRRSNEGYYRVPADVDAILDRWSGYNGRKRQAPSTEELERIEAFLANPEPEMTFHPYQKRVAA